MTEDLSEAERIAAETPALPGDVVVFDAYYRRVVRHAAVVRESRWVGGHDYEPDHKYVVYVDAEEPVQVILSGGGTCLTLPLEVFPWSWPPERAEVWRNGVRVYPPARGSS